MKKVCTVCKLEKNFEEFYNRSGAKDGKAYRCKSCDVKATMTSRKNKSKSQIKADNLWNKYRMTEFEFHLRLEKQGGKCACCEINLYEGYNYARNKVVVDHCHKTGKVRALLCTMCNKGLGLFNDDPEILYKAFRYLNKFKVSNKKSVDADVNTMLNNDTNSDVH